jgi:hypothetical protein
LAGGVEQEREGSTARWWQVRMTHTKIACDQAPGHVRCHLHLAIHDGRSKARSAQLEIAGSIRNQNQWPTPWKMIHVL